MNTIFRHLLHGVAEEKLVGGLLQRPEEADDPLPLVLAPHAQLLVVLEEDLAVAVVAEGGVGGEAGEEGLVHGHRLLEGGQVFGLQLLLHLVELFFG